MACAGWLGLLPGAGLGASSRSASVLCQTLHSAAQPTLTGLMQNDNLLEAANSALRRSNDDNHLFLRNVAVRMARNLDTIAQTLGNGFPPDANSPTYASEELMKTRLQAVASAQNDALNLIDGYVQTEELTQARDEFPAGEPAINEGYHTSDPGTPHDLSVSRERAGTLAALLESARSRIGDLEEPAGSAIVAAAQVCSSYQRPAPAK